MPKSHRTTRTQVAAPATVVPPSRTLRTGVAKQAAPAALSAEHHELIRTMAEAAVKAVLEPKFSAVRASVAGKLLG